jgi:hypothetical protein
MSVLLVRLQEVIKRGLVEVCVREPKRAIPSLPNGQGPQQYES